MTDIEIAQQAKMDNISELAEQRLALSPDDIDQYGRHKAKISLDVMPDLADRPDGKLILVTAVSPTPAGEGKTTTTIGLSDALNHIGKNSMVCVREPSMGPCFGMKGGSRWRWLCSSCANGRYQSSLYRRSPCDQCCP